jgi:hypothetical protein
LRSKMEPHRKNMGLPVSWLAIRERREAHR